MNNAQSQSQLEVMEEQLQQRLLQKFPWLHLQVRCSIKQKTLLVLLEHLLHLEPDAKQTFAEVEEQFRAYPELWTSKFSSFAGNKSKSLAVAVYLRIVGYHQPYATQSFTVERSLDVGFGSALESIPLASGEGAVEVPQAEIQADSAELFAVEYPAVEHPAVEYPGDYLTDEILPQSDGAFQQEAVEHPEPFENEPFEAEFFEEEDSLIGWDELLAIQADIEEVLPAPAEAGEIDYATATAFTEQANEPLDEQLEDWGLDDDIEPADADSSVASPPSTADAALELPIAEPIESDLIEPEPIEPELIESDLVEPEPIESDLIESDPVEPEPIADDIEIQLVEGISNIETQPAPPAELITPELFAAEPIAEPETADAQEPPEPESIAEFRAESSLEPPILPPTVELSAPPVEPPIAAPESQPQPPSGARFSSSTLMLGGSVGLFALVGSLYLVTRPCVLGTTCEPLQKAQQLDQQATQTVKTTESALKVLEAYNQLNEARTLLGTIPPWAGQYQNAQALHSAYEDKTRVIGQVVKGLQQANTAAQKSQNPPHPLPEWRQIQLLWREAIATLASVPSDSLISPLAQRKVKEYQANLASTEQRVLTEQNAQDKVTTAQNTAKVAETRTLAATSSAGWQQVYLTWEAVTALLRQVPQGTMAHSEAQKLISLYRPKMAEADQRRNQDQALTGSLQQATDLAEQAGSLEQKNLWAQSIDLRQKALAIVQQIPQGTAFYGQAQSLIGNYQAALTQAEESLRRLTAMQTAKPKLDRACAGDPKPCTYTLAPAAIRVQITSEYDRTVEGAIANSQVKGSFGTRAETVSQVGDLLQQLSAVSETAKVPLELYNSNGSKFGTYGPKTADGEAR